MTDPLQLPRPAWMTEDLVLLEEQAQRFVNAEFTPHVDAWNEAGMYPREVWDQAGAAGLLCAAMPEEYGGAGGTFAHEAAIIRAVSGSSRPISCITAPRSRRSAGCRSSRAARWSAPSP